MAQLVLVLVATIVAMGCVVIEDGEVGVSKSFGKIDDEPLRPGVVVQLPVIRSVEIWNVKLQEVRETAQVPSSEGLIVGLDTSLLFQVVAQSAPTIRRTVGRDYVDLLIIPVFRNALRDVASGYSVGEVYSEAGRKEIASKVESALDQGLRSRGVHVVNVLLRDVNLPKHVTPDMVGFAARMEREDNRDVPAHDPREMK
jgi:regulator of protease activity HflC (stomatin/prohibitin superfamily)